MPQYDPISREMLLSRGKCCHLGCVNCPYCEPVIHAPMIVDPRILTALQSGETVTIYSERQSLTPVVVLQNLTIIYKPYAENQDPN